MTLITKLEDSAEGLIGVTKSGEKVHLGVPRNFSAIHSLRTSDSDTATARYERKVEEFEQKLESDTTNCYWLFDKNTGAQYHTEDTKLTGWFGDERFVRNYSIILNYARFEIDKEKAIQRGNSKYIEHGSDKPIVTLPKVEVSK